MKRLREWIWRTFGIEDEVQETLKRLDSHESRLAELDRWNELVDSAWDRQVKKMEKATALDKSQIQRILRENMTLRSQNAVIVRDYETMKEDLELIRRAGVDLRTQLIQLEGQIETLEAKKKPRRV